MQLGSRCVNQSSQLQLWNRWRQCRVAQASDVHYWLCLHYFRELYFLLFQNLKTNQSAGSATVHLGAALDAMSTIQDEARVDSYDLSLLASACCFAGVLACWKLPPSLNSFFMSTNLKTDARSLGAIRAKQIDWIVAFVIPLRQIATALMLLCLNDQSTSGAFMRALVSNMIFFS